MAKAPAPTPATMQLSSRERELLDTTIEVLDEYGYDRLTVDEVAARARASKATIYRRWPSKATLITAAIAARLETPAFAQPLDDVPLRSALVHLVRVLAKELRDLHPMIAGLVGEAIRNQELRDSLDEHFVAPRRDSIRDLLSRRQAAGEIRAGVDLEIAGQVPSAIIAQRLLITHEPVDDTLPDRIVDELMLPLLTNPSTSPRQAQRTPRPGRRASATRPQ